MPSKKQDTTEGFKYQRSEEVSAAVRAIIARNMSHNIGSHVLSRKSQTQRGAMGIDVEIVSMTEEAIARLDKANRQEVENLRMAQEVENLRIAIAEEAKHLVEEADIKMVKPSEAIKSDIIESAPTQPDVSERLSAVAEYFLRLVVEEKDREIIIGDLYETYDKVRESRDKRRADFWLCYEVARSVWPFVRRLVIRITGRIVRTRQAD